MNLDEAIKDIPPLLADSELLKKALDHVIVNAIKFTPDGGSIDISAQVVEDARLGKCAEVRVKDTGIGIDAEHHKIIFEKLYPIGDSGIAFLQPHKLQRRRSRAGAGYCIRYCKGVAGKYLGGKQRSRRSELLRKHIHCSITPGKINKKRIQGGIALF